MQNDLMYKKRKEWYKLHIWAEPIVNVFLYPKNKKMQKYGLNKNKYI